VTAREAELSSARARISRPAAAFFFAICAASYVVNAADRVIFPIMLRPLAADYGFTLAQSGFLATAYLLGLGLGGIGSGHLIAHMSRKSTMVVGITVYSLFTLLTPFAFSFAGMTAYRVMSGVGEAMQSVALVVAVGAFYAGSRTFVIGLVQAALGLGMFLGPRLGASLFASSRDWRVPFYIFGAAGLAGAIAVLFVAPGFTEQRQPATAAQAKHESDAHLPDGLFNRNLVAVMISGVFRSFPFFAYLGLYASFLTTERHFPLAIAANALSLFGLGPLFSPLAGYIADRFNQKVFQIALLGTMAAAGLLIFNVADTPLEQDLLSLVFGVAGGFAYANGYSLAQRSVKSAYVARASGYFYAAATLPAAFSGYLMARLVGALGWGPGAIVMMTALVAVPIAVSLAIDTRFVAGRGRRLTSGPRLLR
jgi:MFS family permease